MEESDPHVVSHVPPATERRPEASVAAPTVPPPETQQTVPLPVEGQRNYGYPDDFMIYCFKVEPCTRTDKHPRGSCPYAHAGDVARRRHPSRYQALLCPEVRAKKACPRLDDCQCSHSAFEFWLHPDRYRTSMCEKGAACTRPICFFAHSDEELRPLPQGLKPAEPEPGASASSKRRTSNSSRPSHSIASMQSASVGSGLHYLQQQQQQPQLLLQPGMQLVPMNPAAAAAASGYGPMGYMPIVQQGGESGMPVQYGQLPGGVVMMPSNQPQQYILQQPVQQVQQHQSLEQQFQGLAVASGPMGISAEPAGGLAGNWQPQQQLQPQQQQLMMMPMPGVAGAAAQTAVQYPQQQLMYMHNPAESGTWGYAQQQQTQQQQGAGLYSGTPGTFGSSYVQYGAPNPPVQYSSGGAGFSGMAAAGPAGLQGSGMLAGNPASGLLGPASGVMGGDTGSLGPNVPQMGYGSMQGQPNQPDGPAW